MSYKTILVHVDDSRHAQTRIEMACQLALAEHAHLIGTAMTGVSRFVMQSTAFSPGDPYLAPMLQTMHEQANGALNKFEAIARKFGVRSFEKRLIDDEAGVSMCMQGRYADLLVIGQIDPDERNPVLSDDFPEYVATNCACPVLVVPYALPSEVMGTRVLIAWNASPESTRAVHNAVPLLKRAQLVEVMVFDAGGLAAVHAGDGRARQQRYRQYLVVACRRCRRRFAGHGLLRPHAFSRNHVGRGQPHDFQVDDDARIDVALTASAAGGAGLASPARCAPRRASRRPYATCSCPGRRSGNCSFS